MRRKVGPEGAFGTPIIRKNDGDCDSGISNHSAAVYDRMCPTLKSTVIFGKKLGEEEVDRCKPNFNAMCEKRDMGQKHGYAKEIVSISSAVWAQCTNVTQTNRETDHRTLTSIPICEIVEVVIMLSVVCNGHNVMKHRTVFESNCPIHSLKMRNSREKQLYTSRIHST